MKKYFMSIIDFSEIETITANEEKIEESKLKLKELGLVTEKDNPSTSQITALSKQTSERFLYKLSKRVEKYSDGINGVLKTFIRLEERKEYIAMYMYLAFLYGFLEWRVPGKISLLPANIDALKVFFTQFIKDFKVWLEANDDSGAAQ